MSGTISWDDFDKIDIRSGTIISAVEFPKARVPAYQLVVDFGPEIGTRKSSAQITDHYSPKNLIGKQVLAVVNFPPKQIANFFSECLVLGLKASDNAVVLIQPEQIVENGIRLS